jgi:hypothetical protein
MSGIASEKGETDLQVDEVLVPRVPEDILTVPEFDPGNDAWFYGRQLSFFEQEDMDAALADGLRDEIAMLRVLMRRTLELTRDLDDHVEVIKALSAMGLATVRLANLLKTEKELGGGATATTRMITNAIKRVADEMGLE